MSKCSVIQICYNEKKIEDHLESRISSHCMPTKVRLEYGMEHEEFAAEAEEAAVG